MNTEKRSDSLRIAIVGCGRMGLQHARSTSQLGHRVRVACDVDATRASALAGEHPGCEAITDAATIPWDEVDAGFVCTPPFARGPVELFAAQAGVPIFLEKPIGLSATQCLSALTAFRQTDTITSVGYMNRYRPSVRRARSLLAGESVLGFAGHWVCAAYRVPWWGDAALSGGQLNEQCTHMIDLARHLAGEITEVSAFAQPSADGSGGTAAVSILLRFRNGAVGTVICGCLASEKQIGCRVFTPRGQIVLDGWDFKWSPSAAFGEPPQIDPLEDVFLHECRSFLDAVRTGDRSAIRCDLAEAMRTQRVVDAVRLALGGNGPQRVAPERTVGEAGHAIDYI
jgi:myo-inositol 2-dehydrogenase / D-chiro-inositol 1-dehydrogenase